MYFQYIIGNIKAPGGQRSLRCDVPKLMLNLINSSIDRIFNRFLSKDAFHWDRYVNIPNLWFVQACSSAICTRT